MGFVVTFTKAIVARSWGVPLLHFIVIASKLKTLHDYADKKCLLYEETFMIGVDHTPFTTVMFVISTYTEHV